ncbi:MAG: GFA family protein [Pseudomonadota bacterium]|nr:GFA family protein [Pseudomonadota bacterium]
MPVSTPPSLVTHHGGCHCRRVRFEVDAPASVDALDCNCSICRMSGFRHLIVPASRFRLISGEDALGEYTFNTGAAKHYFCRYCGIKSFYVPRSHPDGIDVNVHCLDAGTIATVRVDLFDDTNREAATAAIAHLSRTSGHGT